jgi:hypothetical protein
VSVCLACLARLGQPGGGLLGLVELVQAYDGTTSASRGELLAVALWQWHVANHPGLLLSRSRTQTPPDRLWRL